MGNPCLSLPLGSPENTVSYYREDNQTTLDKIDTKIDDKLMIKMIKDPIHGFVEFEGDAELELKNLLSDPFFQRLRKVKQLGFSDFVFPSATHSRFGHSLGVYAVAKRMLAIVEPNVKSGNWSREGKACLSAALLHDVGHGMFSHAFEKAITFFFERNPSQAEARTDLRDAVDHEIVSPKIIRQSSVRQVLQRIGGEGFDELVADMILKKRSGCIYTSIISGQLDADRLDYAMRDPYFAGVSSGGIDLDWLLRNLKVGKSSNGDFVYVESKAYVSLEQFLVTLFHLYPTIYLHKRTRGLEYMFALLLSRVFELIADGSEAHTGLPSSHPLVAFFKNPDDLENAMLLDDTLFWGSLFMLREAEDTTISMMAKRIQNREIYPMVDVWRIADLEAASSVKMQEMSALDRVKILHSICGEVVADIKEDSKIWRESFYYDHYDRPIYKPKHHKGGDPQQVNIQVGGKVMDIASISPIVASAATFHLHRIYYDDNEMGARKHLEQAVQATIGVKLNAL